MVYSFCTFIHLQFFFVIVLGAPVRGGPPVPADVPRAAWPAALRGRRVLRRQVRAGSRRDDTPTPHRSRWEHQSTGV